MGSPNQFSAKLSSPDKLVCTVDANRRILELQFRKIYRECHRALHELSTRYQELNELIEYDVYLQRSFSTDYGDLYDKLCTARTLVKCFKSKTSDFVNLRQKDSSEITKLLEKIESVFTMSKKREATTAESLLCQEVNLWRDCVQMKSQLNSWEEENDKKIQRRKKHISPSRRPLKQVSIPLEGSTTPPEVAAFQRFLDHNGGRLGRWTQMEHSVFMRLYATKSHKLRVKDNGEIATMQPEKSRTFDCSQSRMDENTAVDSDGHVEKYPTAFHRMVADALVTRTPEEVLEHECWWNQLKSLENAKRHAIKVWRESRNKLVRNVRTNQISENAQASRSGQSAIMEERETQKSALKKWCAHRKLKSKARVKAGLDSSECNLSTAEPDGNRFIQWAECQKQQVATASKA
ncbi:unnamed protein product [Dicrocoelium dendriticum]|nr:unnamed protein product [Dicrocoelium dendriticum]